MNESARVTVLKLCVISALSFLPFLHRIRGDFVFDDSEAVVKNSDVTSKSLFEPFYKDFWGTNIRSNLSHKSYRPLTVFSFRLNYILSGQRLDSYHFKVTNLICHTICSLLVWLTLQALITTIHRQKRSMQIDVAYWGALLFAVLPVHVESVSGIVGRADLLSGMTFFISFLLYLKATRSKLSNTYLMYFSAAIVVASASMLFKETGVTVLGVCFIYEVVNKHREDVHTFPRKRTTIVVPLHEVKIIRLVLLLMSIVGLVTARWLVMGGTGPEFKPIDNPAAFSQDLFTKMATYNYIYVLNLLLMLWPQWLCFDWSMGCVPLIEKFQDPRLMAVFLLYLYGIAVLYNIFNKKNKGRNKRINIMALCLLIIPFLPASNIFFPVGFVIAERILYIPSAGYCLLVALGFNKLLVVTKGLVRQIIIILFYFLLLAYGLRSWNRSYYWQNEYRLFLSGLAVCPLNAKVHYNVAKIVDAKGKIEWALDEYKEAIRLYPEYYQAMNNLANLLKNKNEYSTAEEYLKTAISLKKDFPAAWMNLGIVLANTKRYEESQKAYETALSYRRNYPDCLYNLGNLFLEINKTDEAMMAWHQAIKLNPKHTLAWSNLLAFLDNSGQAERAMKLFPKAFQELPDSPSINFVGANIFGKQDHYEVAEKYFIRAINLFGNHVQAVHYANLGVLYHRWQKHKLAEEMYIKALKLDPKFTSARKNLMSLQKSKLK